MQLDSRIKRAGQLATEAFTYLNRLQQGDKQLLKTGDEAIDCHITGLLPSDCILYAANSGIGKTKMLFDTLDQILDENEEYLEAVQNNDIIEIADALGDMLYILCGTILEHGLQHKIEAVFDEIQRSNMSKLDEDGLPIINGENGVWDKSRAKGKILKSKNFSEPNLKQFLENGNK